ncbi:MAG TPA: hypothetical protein PLU17_10235 [Chitinophagaceae bacterium]|nr:hypothetical protein [Chitinophagaceae bacterium]
MNKLFLVVLFTFSSLFAMAVKKTPIEKAKEKTEEMQKDLQLTPDQNKKIYDINLKAYTSIAEYDTKKPSKKLKKKQKDIVQNLRDDQYKKILTSAQYQKYKELKKKEKELEKAEEKKLEKLKGK